MTTGDEGNLFNLKLMEDVAGLGNTIGLLATFIVDAELFAADLAKGRCHDSFHHSRPGGGLLSLGSHHGARCQSGRSAGNHRESSASATDRTAVPESRVSRCETSAGRADSRHRGRTGGG